MLIQTMLFNIGREGGREGAREGEGEPDYKVISESIEKHITCRARADCCIQAEISSVFIYTYLIPGRLNLEPLNQQLV